ncbi:MAG: hypothetical protein ABSG95_03065 [Solirubrobacteraceae bacterium]
MHAATTRLHRIYEATRSLPAIVAPILVAAALLGYLAGHQASPASLRVTTRTAFGANISLEYPQGWQQASGAPGIPGLTLTHPLLLAPGGQAAQAGLLSGELPAGETSPLPASFLALLPAAPETEVVNLLDSQAYRYSHMSIPGYARTLDLYVAPDPGGNPTAVACYASAALSAALSACERMVSTITVQGQSHSYQLDPEPVYARRLGAVIGALDRERLAVRREMSQRPSPAAVSGLATTIAGSFNAAAASLSGLEPPLAAGPAQAELATTLLRARDTYQALAAAAGAGSPAGYAPAQNQVNEAEAKVNSALESFVLLGYGHA